MVKSLAPQDRADHQQLQQLVAGLTDGVILIQPDQTIIWANRAALAMHGISQVSELGSTVSEYRHRFELRYRNRHRLPAGQYPMERVLEGQAFDEVLVEVGLPGDKKPRWTHRIRSMVLTDAQGNPDCLALILDDQTARFDAEARFEQSFNANPAPAVILRLDDQRFVRVNQGFVEMLGYGEEEIVGRTIYERDVLEGAKHRDLALERMREHRAVPQMEAWPRLRDGNPKLVLVSGQTIEIGDTECMLFTFADLEPRRQAEAALRQSEERFAKAFRLAPVPMAIASLDDWFRFTLVNDAFAETTGHSVNEAIGRTALELGLWHDARTAAILERRLRETGSVRAIEVRFITKSAGSIEVLLSAEAVTIQDRACAIWSMQDVTERRRTEIDLAAAIEAVMQDTSWFSRTILEKLAKLRQSDNAAPSIDGIADLTPRGREVLGLVCRGLSDETIAEQLALSRTTVRNHVHDLYRRTDAHNRAALVVWARERGFAGTEPGKPARKRRRHP
jgi:PAS domain S-box-containing protein